MIKFVLFVFTLVANSFLITSSSLARGGEPEVVRYQSFSRAYFRSFNPQSARDMVDRLPGFSLDLGSEARGLSINGGNVLIDGLRPASKKGGLEEVLNRIPADAVERIDLIRGHADSSETGGQLLVANIIRRSDSNLGNWSITLERAAGGKLNSTGELSIVKTIGHWETNSRLRAVLDRRPLDGIRQSRDVDGVTTLFQTESRPSDSRTFSLSSEASRKLKSGHIVLNTNITSRPASADTVRFGFSGGENGGMPNSQQEINFDRKILDGEFGVNWSRVLENDWRIKIVSLSSLSDTEENQLSFLEQPDDNRLSSAMFFRDAEEFETILRATASREQEPYHLSSDFGVELAYNRLASNLTLSATTDTGTELISLPADDIVVDENRVELFANLLWKKTDNTALQTGLSAELSEIKVSGDVRNTQSFFFLKPYAFIIYDYQPNVQLRLGGRHSVGQLDFGDFAASASASDDRLTAGNPELGPDQTTRMLFSIDISEKFWGALNIELFHEWRRDVLEESVLPSGTRVITNLGSARVWGLKTIASLPLSQYLYGAMFELEAELLDSNFNDPVTGRRRGLSNIDSPSIQAEFRQDLDRYRISWGVSYQAELEGTFFFVDEESNNLDSSKWDAFVETTRYFGLKTRLSWSSIGGQNFIRQRQFFTPDRGGQLSDSQLINRERGAFASITVSGQF